MPPTPAPHPSTSAWALSQCPIGTEVPSPNWGRVSGPLGGQLVKAKATYGQLTPQQGAPRGRWAFPVCLPHRRMWYPGPVQPLAVRSSLFTGWLGRWCLHTKAPLWGRATRASIPVHSCGPQPGPDNSAPSPLGPAGFCEQSSVDSRAALTPEEFQKWNNARLAWASQAAARRGPRKAVVWGCLLSLSAWLAFQGNPGWGGGRQRGRRGSTENPKVLPAGQSPASGQPRGEAPWSPGQAGRAGRVYAGTNPSDNSPAFRGL